MNRIEFACLAIVLSIQSTASVAAEERAVSRVAEPLAWRMRAIASLKSTASNTNRGVINKPFADSLLSLLRICGQGKYTLQALNTKAGHVLLGLRKSGNESAKSYERLIVSLREVENNRTIVSATPERGATNAAAEEFLAYLGAKEVQ